MSTTDTLSSSAMMPSVLTAEVLETDTNGQFVRIAVQNSLVDTEWHAVDLWARLATGPHVRPEPQDQVLVVGEAPDQLYVIGCLTPPRPQTLKTQSGVYAQRHEKPDGSESLQVLSSDHELLFEADPASGTTRVIIPDGHLQLQAAKGDLLLQSGGTVRVQGQHVELRARHRLTMAVINSVGIAGSWLRMIQDRMQAGGQNLELSAAEADLNLAAARVTSKKVSVQTLDWRLTAERSEVSAETLIERAGNVYRCVRGLVQEQAGRLRTFVSGISHFRSKRAYFSSEETFHVDGEKIHLG